MIKLIIKRKTLLSEVKLEDVLTRLDSKKFKKAYPETTPRKTTAARMYINSAIPSDIEEKYKGALANWMISYLIKNKPKLIDLHDIFDPEFTNSAELFFQIKKQNLERFLTKKSLTQIDSPEELIFIVAEAKPEYDKHIEDKIENSTKGEGQNLIYEDDEWKVYIPETKGAACALGKGTKWCTAVLVAKYYEDIHSKEHPLIIFINKQDPTEKYQFHYKTKEFKDRDNEGDDEEGVDGKLVFFELNDIVKSLSDKLPKETIESANQFKFKKLPNGGYMTITPEAKKYYNSKEQLHREDGPAIEDAYGDKEWYQNGERHRKGEPAIEYASGEKQWWLNDKLHNENGPAIEKPTGTKLWYRYGELHNEDGPAVKYASGSKFWFLNDISLSHSEWKEEVAKLKSKETNSLKEHFKRFL